MFGGCRPECESLWCAAIRQEFLHEKRPQKATALSPRANTSDLSPFTYDPSVCIELEHDRGDPQDHDRGTLKRRVHVEADRTGIGGDIIV